ncbi:SRR1 family protein [Aspergillus tanneri]|uniref:SRR1-like domain-containing protein n=1 Tax=Aspergillus tanneri TaxID=1220188 RepID=A0A5M9MJC0_9EURO|nr:uncharacterized protein ATNIH1004_005798 [Aspergillus tanneri]KAA8647115.1 hypothetical protein ATNIH1004_005798 [Aspergillus tanneri]
MPHTSRKRTPHHQHKRLQVTDDSGWTHVTTSGKSARQVLRTTLPQESQSHPFLPAEAPSRLTQEELQQQLQRCRQRWEDSDTWKVVEETLRSWGMAVDDGIVCIGMGSPRRTHPNVNVYAQDPVLNAHDKFLLLSLGINVLEHPDAFEKVSPATFLYCPGAEQTHLVQLLASNPAFLFGGPLEDIESETVRQFVKTKGSTRLPRFEDHEHAFWNMRLYYPADLAGNKSDRE